MKRNYPPAIKKQLACHEKQQRKLNSRSWAKKLTWGLLFLIIVKILN